MERGATRIAIIGAGPSGLAQLRAFAPLESTGEKIPEIVCFEKQSDWGGMWNFTWRTGLDEHGEPVHASMYRHLWSNAPKECHEYADYSLDRHFSKAIPSFVPRETFRNYILGRAKDSDIRRYIQFSTVVRSVEFDGEDENFSVRAENLITGKCLNEKFDYVLVAVGHYSVPNMPSFKGIETFPGKIIHSHDLRDAKHFTGEKILIIGGNLSAEDIALQTYKFGAESITITYRTKRYEFKWPKEIEEKSLLTKIEGRTVYFPDGSTREFDSIIYCTGYKHYFPFITEDMRLNATNNLYPNQLYKGIFFQDQPRLIYLAMQNLFFSSSIFDAQAWFVRDTIVGRIVLPSKEERAVDMETWQTRESQIQSIHDGIDFQAAYIKDLVEPTKCPMINLDEMGDTFKVWLADKQSNILHFRDKPYTSSITGTTAVPHHTPWIDVKNDLVFHD